MELSAIVLGARDLRGDRRGVDEVGGEILGRCLGLGGPRRHGFDDVGFGKVVDVAFGRIRVRVTIANFFDAGVGHGEGGMYDEGDFFELWELDIRRGLMVGSRVARVGKRVGAS